MTPTVCIELTRAERSLVARRLESSVWLYPPDVQAIQSRIIERLQAATPACSQAMLRRFVALADSDLDGAEREVEFTRLANEARQMLEGKS